MQLLLIRHGESEANFEGRLQGQLDSPLTNLGRAQARALADRLRREGWRVGTVHSSDLLRASETAEIIASVQGARVVLDERLREYDVGVLTGLVWREIESLYPDIWYGLNHSREWVRIPGEEGNRVFRVRLREAMADIRSRLQDGQAAVVVSHGGSLGTILAELLGMDPERPTPFRFGNASLSVVELQARGPVLIRLNDTCHLPAANR